MGKRIVLVVLLLFGGALSALPQGQLGKESITVTKPDETTGPLLGKPFDICWTWQTNLVKTVTFRLILFRNGQKIGLIDEVQSSSVNNRYTWTAGQYQGGMAAPGTGYVIRVRKLESGLDALSPPFTIGKQGPPAPVRAEAAIVFSSPTAQSVWVIDEERQIAWKAAGYVEYPLQASLCWVGHPLVKNLGSVGSADSRPEQLGITVPGELPAGQYRVRLRDQGLKTDVYSPTFRVSRTKTKEFTSPGTSVNKVCTRYHQSATVHIYDDSKPFCNGSSPYGPDYCPIRDQGPEWIKYGYQRWWSGSNAEHEWWIGHVHRSLLRFNLQTIHFQGKPTVKQARLLVDNKLFDSLKGNPIFWVMDTPVPEVTDGMFGELFDGLLKHRLTLDNCARMVQEWLDHPERNYGIVVQAGDEGDKRMNGSAMQFDRLIRLKGVVEDDCSLFTPD